MVELGNWTEGFLQALDARFGERVQFVGLQGSYARGEAGEHSDIDMVVILDVLSAADIQSYHDMLEGLEHRERICGFLSGKQELQHWEPSDLFHFYYDTLPLRGSLETLLPMPDAEAAEHAVRIGACNIYHACVHNMLHEKSDEILRSLYKSASFVLQAICFLKTGRYIRRLEDVIAVSAPEEKAIAECFSALKRGSAVEFQRMSRLLFEWSGRLIRK